MSMLIDEESANVELPIGTKIDDRWLIIDKIAEGCFGSVYQVEDCKNGTNAALKAESNYFIGGTFLDCEIRVLNQMQNQKFIPKLIESGSKEEFGYIVLSLCGPDLSQLFNQCNREFSVSTQVRLGMQILFSLKQLHDNGFIHRDIKPSNLAIGRNGLESKMIHLLDFGLAREYVVRGERQVQIRTPRKNVLFKGTVKYCSANIHSRSEHGRADDLWSMLYILTEMRGPLPWEALTEMKDIEAMKNTKSDEELLNCCQPEMLLIAKHLRTLNYYKRPDYRLIFDVLFQIMTKYNYKYSDPFDWETQDVPIKPVKNKFFKILSRIVSVCEDTLVLRKNQTSESAIDSNLLPFSAEDFSKNELGF